MRRIVQHPVIPFAAKERVLQRVATGIRPDVLSLVLLMIRRGRPRGIEPMRTALPLEDEQRRAVTERLGELTGETVEMNEVVDESLIGGIAVRIGDRLYDASVRNRLERLRARLTAV